MKRALFDALQAARAAKRPVALITELESGQQALLDGGISSGGLVLSDTDLALARRALEDDRSGPLEETNLFVHVFNPPLRLIVVGAVHIAQLLVPMAALAGYEVVVADPRQAWATGARFPDVELVTEWPDDALQALKLDRRSAVAVLTHDPKLDDPALEIALDSPAFYVGALGSKRTHAKRLTRLREAGVSEPALERIHAPIGLAVGAKSPAEISIAILAQMTQALHGAPPLIKAGAQPLIKAEAPR